MLTWKEAVTAAVHRIAAKKSDGIFTRQELVDEEGARMCANTGTAGETPMQTVSRVMQELRDDNVVTFVDNRGTYRLND